MKRFTALIGGLVMIALLAGCSIAHAAYPQPKSDQIAVYIPQEAYGAAIAMIPGLSQYQADATVIGMTHTADASNVGYPEDVGMYIANTMFTNYPGPYSHRAGTFLSTYRDHQTYVMPVRLTSVILPTYYPNPFLAMATSWPVRDYGIKIGG